MGTLTAIRLICDPGEKNCPQLAGKMREIMLWVFFFLIPWHGSIADIILIDNCNFHYLNALHVVMHQRAGGNPDIHVV